MIFRRFTRPIPNNIRNSKNYTVKRLVLKLLLTSSSHNILNAFIHSTCHIYFVKNIMIFKLN
jgi:hypothetical protein